MTASTPAFSTPAFSTRAVYSCYFHSRIFRPCNFDRIAFSTPAFSVAPLPYMHRNGFDILDSNYLKLTMSGCDSVTALFKFKFGFVGALYYLAEYCLFEI